MLKKLTVSASSRSRVGNINTGVQAMLLYGEAAKKNTYTMSSTTGRMLQLYGFAVDECLKYIVKRGIC